MGSAATPTSWDDRTSSGKQSHRAGPASFTHYRLSDTQNIKFQAAYLVGKTYGLEGRMFTMRAGDEF